MINTLVLCMMNEPCMIENHGNECVIMDCYCDYTSEEHEDLCV